MVCEEVNFKPLAIQSDWARQQGQWVSAAASLGLITTKGSDGFGRQWRLTLVGNLFLETGAL